MHSTRNNSFAEAIMQENITVTNISNGEEVDNTTSQKKEVLKFTCRDCDYITKVKHHMDRHVKSVHKPELRDVNFVCGICNHVFQKRIITIHM